MTVPIIDFECDVARNGYAWWYLDAVSDDGRYGATVIVFIGSVFSPYYYRARARSAAGVNPRAHCAFNVALYGKGGRWAMTERGAQAIKTDPSRLAIGPSCIEWDGQRLVAHIDELTVPVPRRLRGRIEIQPSSLTEQIYRLDARGHHLWHPLGPIARARVHFDSPGLDWEGHGYIDHNRGDRPLEKDFLAWQWSRAAGVDHAVIHYETRRRDHSEQCLALGFDRQGRVSRLPPAPAVSLPATHWRIPRSMRTQGTPRIAATLEDAPFYARSLVDTTLDNKPVQAIHESLSMTRFKQPAVQAMLPFRMPRRRKWKQR